MKQTGLLLVTIIGTLLMAVAVIFFLSKSAATPQVNVDQNMILAGARHSLGPITAPVTIVEFSDFQCPACRSAQPLVKNILSQYGNQVRLVYRHFPLTDLHPYAYMAAQSSEAVNLIAASDSAKFWAFHDVLFDQQNDWTTQKDNDTVKAKLTQYAIDLGIDKAKFSERMSSQEAQTLVNDDMRVGNQANITFTPSFFVNGTLYSAGELQQAVAQAIKNQTK